MTDAEQAVRVTAYFIWQKEGCPQGREAEHWSRAVAALEAQMGDEEKIMANRPDANLPALLTKDVLGG